MAAQKGKDLLVKLDMTGSGSFQTVAGLRATRITFNAQTVDVTNIGSAGRWRELLAGAGVRSAAISGSGVFRDEASDERARAIFFAGEIPAFQVMFQPAGEQGVVDGIMAMGHQVDLDDGLHTGDVNRLGQIHERAF